MEVVLTAVTKMHNGICIAGIDIGNRKWVRPVPTRGQWQAQRYETGETIEVGDLVQLNAPFLRPAYPHTEDVEVTGLKLKGVLSAPNFQRFLARHAEGRAAVATLAGRNRSLCLVKVDRFWTAYADVNDPHSTRLGFQCGGVIYQNRTLKAGYPCTDLRWRAYKGARRPDPTTEGSNNLYIAVGLARAFTDKQGRSVPPSPMVVGVFTFPDYMQGAGRIAL